MAYGSVSYFYFRLRRLFVALGPCFPRNLDVTQVFRFSGFQVDSFSNYGILCLWISYQAVKVSSEFCRNAPLHLNFYWLDRSPTPSFLFCCCAPSFHYLHTPRQHSFTLKTQLSVSTLQSYSNLHSHNTVVQGLNCCILNAHYVLVPQLLLKISHRAPLSKPGPMYTGQCEV